MLIGKLLKSGVDFNEVPVLPIFQSRLASLKKLVWLFDSVTSVGDFRLAFELRSGMAILAPPTAQILINNQDLYFRAYSEPFQVITVGYCAKKVILLDAQDNVISERKFLFPEEWKLGQHVNADLSFQL